MFPFGMVTFLFGFCRGASIAGAALFNNVRDAALSISAVSSGLYCWAQLGISHGIVVKLIQFCTKLIIPVIPTGLHRHSRGHQ